MPDGADEYLSCEWIEGGIAFNRRSLHACLIVHHRTGMPVFADYNGGVIPFEEILRAREGIRQANKSGEVHPECRGCAHLKRKSWSASSHPINIVGIAQYSHCNIECNYCFLQTQDRSSFESGFRPYRLRETIGRLIDEDLLAPDAIIDWGGGEPTVYREFDDILSMTLERGAFHYVHTNGVRLPPLIRDTPHADRIHIICSVDAGLPETYLLMKKRDYLEVVWTNLADYIRAGCLVTLKYIVREDNCSHRDLDAFLQRAVEIGAKDLIVDIDYDSPDPKPEVIAALARLQHRATRAGLHARFGFTGDNFAEDNQVASRVLAAFEHEQLMTLRDFLIEQGYSVSRCLDQTVESLVRRLDGNEKVMIEQSLALQQLQSVRALATHLRHQVIARLSTLFRRREARCNTAD
jgi:Radical SAM superfamily